MQSIDSKILSRIYGRGKGCVVTPGDFMDLGSRQEEKNKPAVKKVIFPSFSEFYLSWL